jgi:tetratricopeptide (TPR) repeat protein/O-antigen ligase
MTQKNIEKLLNVFPVILSFLMPLFFLPITVEYYEFNKLYLLILVTAVMVILWAIKTLITKEVSLVKSKLDVVLLCTFGAFLLSSIFSVNKTSSIYGSNGRWFPTLASVSTLILFYYVVSAAISSEKTIKKVLLALTGGITFTIFAGMLVYFETGILSLPYLQQLNFSFTGSTASLTLISIFSLVIAVQMINSATNYIEKTYLSMAGVLAAFAIIVFGNSSLYMLSAVALVIVLALNSNILTNKINYPFYAIIGSFALVVVLLMNASSTKDLLINTKYPVESRLSFSNSWLISMSALRDYPLVGTGPSTYYLNYARYKPTSQNNTETWNIRFDKPNNEVLNIIGTMGLVGLLAIALLIVVAIRMTLGTKNTTEATLASVVLVGISSLFFTNSTVLGMYILFLGLSLLSANYAINASDKAYRVVLSITSVAKSFSILGKDDNQKNKEVFHYIVIIPLLIVVIVSSYFLARNYLGEMHIRIALNSAANGKGNDAYINIAKAISYNPRRDNYHTLLARTNIALANNLEEKKNLSDKDKQTIQSLILQAVNASKTASETLNPLNVENWETRAFVYGTLRTATKDAFDLEIKSYNTAIRLDPTNPILRVSAGGAYFAKEDYLSAGNLFAQAVNLKPDYANAHYNLGFALANLKSYDRAIQELQLAQKLISKDSQDFKRLDEEIAKLQKQAQAAKDEQVAGAKDEKLSVEELAGQNQPKVKTPQPPLTNPATTPNQTLNQKTLETKETPQSTPSR